MPDNKNLQVPLFDIALSLCDAMDLVSEKLANHHKSVAYTAVSIADELGLSKEQKNQLLLAGVLHDSGALSEKERDDIATFDSKRQPSHAELGYWLL